MNKELFFILKPASFQNKFLVYSPTVEEVIMEKDYGLFVKVLTFSQEDIEDIFTEEGERPEKFPTPLEFLLSNCYESKEYEDICKRAFSFFLHQNVNFSYEQKTILVGDLKEILKQIEGEVDTSTLPVLSEENFFDFQNLIREAVNSKTVDPPNPDEHPRLKAMKAKQRLRDRVKAKQSKGTSLFHLIVAICCMGIGITPLNIGEMSYVALQDIVAMYQGKEKYELDINTLLAGGDSKKIKPKYWIENFDN